MQSLHKNDIKPLYTLYLGQKSPSGPGQTAIDLGESCAGFSKQLPVQIGNSLSIPFNAFQLLVAYSCPILQSLLSHSDSEAPNFLLIENS